MGTAYNMTGGGAGGGIKLQSIAITAPPARTSYLDGEAFDPTGMVVTAAYSNGATLAATGYAVEPSGPLADGVTAVTVRYTEGGRSAAATQPITVIHRLLSISIETPPAKTEYQAGEVFDPAGMAVLAAYSDGGSAAVTGYTVPTEAFAAPGPQTVAVTYTENGVTASASVSVTVARLVIETVPSQSGSPTYTGEAITLELENYDPAQLTLGGTTSAVNAGEYAATVTPTESWQWSDGTTGAKPVVWTIGKAAGSVSIPQNSVTLDASTPMVTLPIDWEGDGTMSAVSSDTGVAVLQVVDGGVGSGQVLIYAVANTSGTATVTVTVSEGSNHLAVSGTVAVTASFVQIYGAEWDGTATTKLTRTDAAALFTDPVPAVGTGAGSSPFDNIMPWSGMVRVTQDGNELVAIPKYWLKVSHAPFKVQISNTPVDGFQVSPAHRDREDGHGERDVVYIGRYECNSSYKSVSKQAPKVSTNIATFRTGIHNLGAEYWQADYALQLTWWFLYIVEFADWDGQTAIGQGVNNRVANTGDTDSMNYHTGRTAGTDSNLAIQYRGIENLWGSISEWRDGIVFSTASICTYNNPANFSNSYSGAGGTVRSNRRPTSSGFIKAWGHDSNDPSFIFLSDVVADNTSYVPDCYFYYGPSIRAARFGGEPFSSNAEVLGPFGIRDCPINDASKYNGSRIMKLPNPS